MEVNDSEGKVTFWFSFGSFLRRGFNKASMCSVLPFNISKSRLSYTSFCWFSYYL